MKLSLPKRFSFAAAVIALSVSLLAHANQSSLNKDVQSLESIVNSYYKVVSGPKGFKYNAEADSFYHAPKAMITRFNENNGFQRHDLLKEQESLREPYSEGFYEVEIHRISEEYENIAHVWSTFEMRNSPDSEAFMKGVNSISFYYKNSRWFISSRSTQYEGENKIPKKYLSEN